MVEYKAQFQKLCQTRARRLVTVMVLISFVVVLVFQTATLPSGNDSPPLFPTAGVPVLGKKSFPIEGYPRSKRVVEVFLVSDPKNSSCSSLVHKEVDKTEVLDEGAKIGDDYKIEETDGEPNDDLDLEGNPDKEFSVDLGNGVILKKVRDPVAGFITLEKVGNSESGILLDGISKTNTIAESQRIKSPDNNYVSSPPPLASHMNENLQVVLDANSSDPSINVVSNISSLGKHATKELPKNEQTSPLSSGLTNPTVSREAKLKKNKKQVNEVMTTLSISEMNHLLLRNCTSSLSVIPQWPSACDQQIIDAKAQIENAPMVKNDQELYAPLFRNMSTFRRSYELMEQTLKVYIYKEGEKPIIHQPGLEGIYASEGWFMKLMEGSRQFVVKDPTKAHLFYMPFSSHSLQVSLYVPGSHSHRNLIEYLNNYVDTIAAKYPFWNRTGGADHFLAACHDWTVHNGEVNDTG